MISVIINDGEPSAIQLDTELTLNSVRQELSKSLQIYQNMFFVSPKGKIKDESKTVLKDALKGDSLIIQSSIDHFDKDELINI